MATPEEINAYLAAQGGSSDAQDPVLYWGPTYWETGTPNTKSIFGGRDSATAGPGSSRVQTTPPESIFGGRVSAEGGPGSGSPSGPNYQDSPMRLSGAVSYMRGLLVDDPKQFYKIGDAMVAQGHLKASYSPEDVIKVWTAAAQVAADYYQGGAGKKLTVGQVLSLYAPANAGAGLSDLAGTGVGPGRLQQQTFHSTESTANISSASELTEPGRQAAQQEIGRELTPAEFGKLVAAVQGAQHAAPSITTQSGTTTTSADGTDTSSARNTTTTGGVDVNQLIDDQLRANPNYAEHQAAAHFMPLLMSALGATV